jgi:hypothetical protein
MDINAEKLKKYLKLSKGGATAIFIALDDLEEEITKIRSTIDKAYKGDKGEDGDDYVLTEKDISTIASLVKVPVVEKVIERTEVVKEQPIIQKEEVTKVVEVAKYEDAEQIATKLNTKKEIINVEVIKGLRKQLDELEAKLFIVANEGGASSPPSGSTGQLGVYLLDEGTKVNTNPIERINFAGSGVTVSYVGQDTAVVTVSGATLYTETPVGDIDGVNVTFTTTKDITNVYSFAINGQFLHPTEYSVSGNTITFNNPIPADLAGTNFTIIYA